MHIYCRSRYTITFLMMKLYILNKIKAGDINATVSAIKSILNDKVAPDNELKILTSAYEQLKSTIAYKMEKSQDQAAKDRIKQIEL